MVNPPATPRAAYIHVPFCKKRCGYCDFAVIAGRDELVEPFLEAIARELSWLGEPRSVDTLYFGGGTPSYLSMVEFARLADLVEHWHPLAAGAEWTLEANPEHMSADLVELWRDRGVNRLSLGLQSFDDAKLKSLDRDHTAADAELAVKLAQAAGLNLSVDLIFGAPGESFDAWIRDVQTAIDLRPDHVSTYGLTYERGTAFTHQRDLGRLAPADELLERDMYAAGIDMLAAAGFEHYEVSNFAQPGRRSRHNEAYWAGADYFAAGPGAARHTAGVRETNHKSTVAYINRALAGQSPVDDREELSPELRARERLVLGLRRLEGVRREEFQKSTGFALDDLAGEPITRFTALNLLADDGERVRLTREGLMISDALWPEML